jgi:hypothetical protein
MALSEVEQLLFNGISKATHVEHFRIHNGQLFLGVTNEHDHRSLWSASFDEVELVSMNVLGNNPLHSHLPWDLVGFGCQHLDDDRWRFMVRCAPIEFVFESRWPKTNHDLSAMLPFERKRAVG